MTETLVDAADVLIAKPTLLFPCFCDVKYYIKQLCDFIFKNSCIFPLNIFKFLFPELVRKFFNFNDSNKKIPLCDSLNSEKAIECLS